MMSFHRIVLAALLLIIAGPALAHEVQGAAGGFVTGFVHPLLGLDHVAAMVAVGLWGAFLSTPAIWVLPVAFPLVMALGGALGAMGIALPAVETGIAASAIVIGIAVALALRPPLWIAALVVALFAIFHGHAHGAEMPDAVSPLAYAAGFVIGTGLLHLAGIALGLLTRSRTGAQKALPKSKQIGTRRCMIYVYRAGFSEIHSRSKTERSLNAKGQASCEMPVG